MDVDDKDDSSLAGTEKAQTGRFGWLAVISVALTVAVVVIVGMTAGSFLRFSRDVVTMAPPATIADADGIVVLTGGPLRISRAVTLLDEGRAERLLISGVFPATTGQRIQRELSAEPALFECCVDIGHEAIDTRSNATEAALWVRENGYRDVILVTSNYHMPRSLMELRRADGQTRFIPYPVIDRDYAQLDWLYDYTVLRMLLIEYSKYIIARFRSDGGGEPGSGLATASRSSATPTVSSQGN